MSMLRAFIAIEIPTQIQQSIQQQTAVLRQALGSEAVRWVPPQNVHLTIKFLGDVSVSNIELLKQMLVVEAGQLPPFEIAVGGLGCFPNSRRARVIWIGLKTPPAMETLQHAIETASARLGYSSEDRKFSPHLTIGRVSQRATGSELQQIRAGLEGASVGELGSAPVQAVHLFKSDLQPAGAVYTCLFSAPLGGAGLS